MGGETNLKVVFYPKERRERASATFDSMEAANAECARHCSLFAGNYADVWDAESNRLLRRWEGLRTTAKSAEPLVAWHEWGYSGDDPDRTPIRFTPGWEELLPLDSRVRGGKFWRGRRKKPPEIFVLAATGYSPQPKSKRNAPRVEETPLFDELGGDAGL